jgi:protein SCO1
MAETKEKTAMSVMTRRVGLTTLGLALVGAGVAAWSESKPPATTSLQPAGANVSPRERIQRKHLPNVELVTHQGKTVRFYDDLVKDKKVVINFMYTRCADGVCPITTANLVRLQKLLHDRVGRDFFFYSVTLTPEHDTPTVLERYARAYGVGPGWLFLTGKPGDIERLRRGLGFAARDPLEDADKARHVGMLRYGTEPLMIWGAVPGMSNPDHLLRVLLWEFDRPLPSNATILPAV